MNKKKARPQPNDYLQTWISWGNTVKKNEPKYLHKDVTDS